MNKTDRLLAIVLELQGKGKQRAEDLARTFETSKRTIYRDIEALCEAGVPLISIPGQGYSLMEGYFLPPLSFTSDQATMLLLGSEFMERNFDAQYRMAAQAASRKIAGVLPVQLRDEVAYLQNNIRFISTEQSQSETDTLQQLRRAILERTTVHFSYFARHGVQDTATTREADPYGLVYMLGNWHLIAYCHTRQDIRNFRLDRIEHLELLSKTFTRPSNFVLQDNSGDRRNILVRVLFDKAVARWVHESHFYYVTDKQETSEGLLVTLRIRQESEILQWLLSWGRSVRIVEPESLRLRLLEETKEMLRNYQKSSQDDNS